MGGLSLWNYSYIPRKNNAYPFTILSVGAHFIA